MTDIMIAIGLVQFKHWLLSLGYWILQWGSEGLQWAGNELFTR